MHTSSFPRGPGLQGSSALQLKSNHVSSNVQPNCHWNLSSKRQGQTIIHNFCLSCTVCINTNKMHGFIQPQIAAQNLTWIHQNLVNQQIYVDVPLDGLLRFPIFCWCLDRLDDAIGFTFTFKGHQRFLISQCQGHRSTIVHAHEISSPDNHPTNQPTNKNGIPKVVTISNISDQHNPQQ